MKTGRFTIKAPYDLHCEYLDIYEPSESLEYESYNCIRDYEENQADRSYETIACALCCYIPDLRGWL